MVNVISYSIVLAPISVLISAGLFFFVLKVPKDLGIYLGWLPSLVFLMLSIFLSLYALIPLVITLAIYIVAATLRMDRNKKLKEESENKLKEIDRMSISDL